MFFPWRLYGDIDRHFEINVYQSGADFLENQKEIAVSEMHSQP
jgi:hypothetical protein